MRLASADDCTQLVLHLFAHVHIDQVGDLYQPRYADWARRYFPIEVDDLARHLGARIAANWTNVLHALPELFDDWRLLRRALDRSFSALRSNDVSRPEWLTALHRVDPAVLELVQEALRGLAPAFESVLDDVIRPRLQHADLDLRPWVDMASVAFESVAHDRVELVWALGPHGRAMPRRILVGVPAAWNEVTSEAVVVLALHEHHVREAASDYVRGEWNALCRMARGMRRAPEALRSAHARWLASLDLRSLVAARVAHHGLDPREARALVTEREERAERLASASSGLGGSLGGG